MTLFRSFRSSAIVYSFLALAMSSDTAYDASRALADVVEAFLCRPSGLQTETVWSIEVFLFTSPAAAREVA